MSERTIKKLKNGLRIVHVPFDNIDSATFRLYGRAGSLWEEEKINYGAAHYLEHVVFEGTQKYSSAEKLRRVIEDIGGNFNAFTSFDRVGYIAKTLKGDVEKGLDFLSQIVMYPLISEKSVNKHKGIITQELKSKLDNPVLKFILNSEKILYPKDHRRVVPVIGTLESINNISSDTLKNYLNKNYTAENFVLGICINEKSENVFDLAEKYFGNMKKGAKNEYKPLKGNGSLKIYNENNKEINQATLTFEFYAPRKHQKDSYATVFLEEILGGSSISRINTEIREKRGLAYSVGTGYHDDNDLGLFSVYAQIDEKNHQEVINLLSFICNLNPAIIISLRINFSRFF